MDTPTAADIRARSQVNFAEYGYVAPVSPAPDTLAPLVLEALAEFDATLIQHDVKLVWADLDGTDTLSILSAKAIRMWTEWLVASGQPEAIDTVGDFDLLGSWSAGPISESRRNISPNLQMLHVWPQLDRILRGIVKILVEEITSDMQPDIPGIQALDPMVPKPGHEVMRRRGLLGQTYGEYGGIYGALPIIGGDPANYGG